MISSELFPEGKATPTACPHPSLRFTLDDVRFLDLLPDRITDEYMEALAYAIDSEMREITEAICEALIMTRIDELPEPVVDLLAWQLHVDFYEPLGLTLDKKRALVKNSLIWHRYKGTKYVLEDMIRILFFDNFKIEEWFEYGGEPYFFRLVSSDGLTCPKQHDDLLRAIQELKNERSWLEMLRFEGEIRGTVSVGIVGRRTSRFWVGGTLPDQPSVKPATVNAGFVCKQTEVFIVQGKGAPGTEVAGAAIKTGLAGRITNVFIVQGKEAPGAEVAGAAIKTGLAGRYTNRFAVGAKHVPSEGHAAGGAGLRKMP